MATILGVLSLKCGMDGLLIVMAGSLLVGCRLEISSMSHKYSNYFSEIFD